MSKKIIFFLAVITIVAGFFVFMNSRDQDQASKKNDVDEADFTTVVTSFYPLAHFAQKVGGDQIKVYSITPGGVEPHDYEPTPQDIIRARSADVFIFNGAGLDSWAENLAEELERLGVEVIKMTQSVLSSEDKRNDPHIWLSPALAARQVEVIRDTLTKTDLSRADFYQKNADNYIKELERLDNEYKIGLANCARREVIVSHDAFGYLASDYGLSFYAIAGLSPENEPSAKRLADLVELVRAKKITHIFFETLVGPKLAQTIANETGANISVLNPIEGLTDENEKAGESYDSLMRDNLARLRESLSCD